MAALDKLSFFRHVVLIVSVILVSRGGGSAEDLVVRIFVETNDQCLSFTESWRSEIARRAEQQFLERVVVGTILLQIDMHHLFALGGVQFIDLTNQF